ncbi:fibronectin type III domain-containing protein, partial [Kibdelosporangium lantanae]
PAQTTVKEFADQGILTPQPGGKPAAPTDLKLLPGPHRLQVSWRGNPDTSGYEIRLRDRTRLVTDTTVQLDGLDNNTDYDVQVRAVDAYGQRSDPVAQLAATLGCRELRGL